MDEKSGGKMPKFYGAVVVGERGQIVIPAGARRDLDINPGEKLIILGSPNGDGLMITKAESMLKMLSRAAEYMTRFENLLKESNGLQGSDEG